MKSAVMLYCAWLVTGTRLYDRALLWRSLSSFFFFNDADERSRSFAGPQGNSAISGFVFFFFRREQKSVMMQMLFLFVAFCRTRNPIFHVCFFFLMLMPTLSASPLPPLNTYL